MTLKARWPAHRALLGRGLLVLIASAGPAMAADWVAATTALRTPHVSAFASVQTSGLVTIAPIRPGTIGNLAILPGQTIAANQVIASLSGPQIVEASVEAEAAVTRAEAAHDAAQHVLAIDKQNRRLRLSTRQAVDQATSALADATAQLAVARAKLNTLRETTALRSPSAGVVRSVTVANGDIVTTGQAVATVQPDTGTWLRAVLYSKPLPGDAAGLFTPSNGGSPIKVSVRGPLGSTLPDGGVPVALTAAERLAPGTFGTVTLDLPPRRVTLVPSQAFILDQGKWWVMAHTPAGDQAVQVIPGPVEGYDTVIESGLQPGQDVVVTNAYLLYHRGVAALYHPPD